MRKAWKKAVSVLLTLVLIFGVLPAMKRSSTPLVRMARHL